MKIFATIIGAIVSAVVAIVALAALFSLPVWLLWNWLVPAIFGLKTITWIQAWGLMVLCGCLFKSSNINTKAKEEA